MHHFFSIILLYKYVQIKIYTISTIEISLIAFLKLCKNGGVVSKTYQALLAIACIIGVFSPFIAITAIALIVRRLGRKCNS